METKNHLTYDNGSGWQGGKFVLGLTVGRPMIHVAYSLSGDIALNERHALVSIDMRRCNFDKDQLTCYLQ